MMEIKPVQIGRKTEPEPPAPWILMCAVPYGIEVVVFVFGREAHVVNVF